MCFRQFEGLQEEHPLLKLRACLKAAFKDFGAIHIYYSILLETINARMLVNIRASLACVCCAVVEHALFAFSTHVLMANNTIRMDKKRNKGLIYANSYL